MPPEPDATDQTFGPTYNRNGTQDRQRPMNDENMLEFDVVECTSEEDGFECSALKHFNQDGEGWKSQRNCAYPQVLVLKVSHQDETRVVEKLEILCHEFCIPETIEIVIGSSSGNIDGPSTFDDCVVIQKLGYISLGLNQQSGFRDRELKSVPIQQQALQKRVDFIKLIIGGCHDNPYNTQKQVGLVGIRMITNAIETMDIKMPEPKLIPKALPPHVKHDLDPKIAQSVDRLEKLKKERAALEVSSLG